MGIIELPILITEGSQNGDGPKTRDAINNVDLGAVGEIWKEDYITPINEQNQLTVVEEPRAVEKPEEPKQKMKTTMLKI